MLRALRVQAAEGRKEHRRRPSSTDETPRREVREELVSLPSVRLGGTRIKPREDREAVTELMTTTESDPEISQPGARAADDGSKPSPASHKLEKSKAKKISFRSCTVVRAPIFF